MASRTSGCNPLLGVERLVLPALLVLAASCSPAPGPEGAEPTARTALDEAGRELGSVRFPTSCDSEATVHLERGLALLHHMTYLAAEVAFRTASEVDSECALSYWGQAMSYLHPLWPDVVPTEKLLRGRELLARARSSSHSSEREKAYVDAAAGYFAAEVATEGERLADFLSGWQRVADSYPDDSEARLFHALALMATAPGAENPLALKERAGEMTESVLAEIPDHPGAHHYTIHAYDVPPLADRALATARRYGEVAPENSHALHMTSHIFTRLGLWPESIDYNRRAADAALDRNQKGEVSMHLLHALDYLAYAHLQQGNDAQAVEIQLELESLEPPFQDHGAVAYAFAAVPTRLLLEQRKWSEAAQLELLRPREVSWTSYPHLVAIGQFARGLGAARSGDLETATEAQSSLAELEQQARALPGAYDWGTQVELQRLTVEAWSAWASGDKEAALEIMQRAAKLESGAEKNPVTPGEVLPAQELYAEMLLLAGQPGAAAEAYEAALGRSPNRYWSLLGAYRAATEEGDAESEESYRDRLLEITSTNCEREGLKELVEA